MFRILLLLFVVLPIIEIAVLLQVGSVLGGWVTLLLIIATAIAGAALVRQQGMQNWLRAQRRMAHGEMPGSELANGVLIFIAGIVLITPGFVTDIIGLLLLFPATRRPIAKLLMTKLIVRAAGPGAGFAHFQFQQRRNSRRDEHNETGSTIEGEYERRHDRDSQLPENDEKK